MGILASLKPIGHSKRMFPIDWYNEWKKLHFSNVYSHEYE